MHLDTKEVRAEVREAARKTGRSVENIAEAMLVDAASALAMGVLAKSGELTVEGSMRAMQCVADLMACGAIDKERCMETVKLMREHSPGLHLGAKGIAEWVAQNAEEDLPTVLLSILEADAKGRQKASDNA